MGGESLLETGDPVDLAGDQNRPVIEERRLPLFDDVKACVIQGAAAGSGDLNRVAARNELPAPVPKLRMDQHRQVPPAKGADEARQPGGVVEVAVAAHDGLDAPRIPAQAA